MFGPMPDHSEQPLSDRDLELTASAVLRAVETVGADVFGDGARSAWDLVGGSVLQQCEAGAIPPDVAGEELRALSAVAALSGDPGVRDRLDGFLFSRPLVRRALKEAVSAPAPDAAERLLKLGRDLRAAPSPADAGPGTSAAASGRREHEPIREGDIRNIAHHFTAGWDVLDMIFHPRLEQLTNLATGVIAEASWLTGVRPAEWPDAELKMEEGTGRRPVHEIYGDALAAAPLPDPEADRQGFLARARGALVRIVESAPVWLEVRTAKSNWLRRHGLPTMRSIGLGRATTDQKIAVLCATAGIRRIGPGRWDAWQRRINRRLQAAVPSVLPQRRDRRLTLYSCRHDFIDRAKATLPPEEVAALAGHSSERTKGHYGRPRAKGSAGAVAPAVADPAEVGAIRAHLELRSANRPGTEPAADRAAEAGSGSPSPAPSPSFGGGSP